MKRLGFGCAILLMLLAACAQHRSSSVSTTLRLQGLPAEVQEVTLSLTGPENLHFESAVSGGSATFELNNVTVGTYTATARGLDRANGIVLYKGVQSVDITGETPITLKMTRLSSSVNITATGVSSAATLVVTSIGATEARLITSGSAATGALLGVPTGRNLSLLINAYNASGTLIQQAHKSFDLSEDDVSLTLSLTEVSTSSPPDAPQLSGAASVKENVPYSLSVKLHDPNPGGTQLKSLSVTWGDGSSDAFSLSGSDADKTLTHTYTAPGVQTITATVTNTAGLGTQGTLKVQVLETTNGSITVDVGNALSSVTLELTNAPSDAGRVQAIVTPTSSSTQALKLKPLDLKDSYTLELIPRGSDTWSATLGLPQNVSYQLQFSVIANGATVSSTTSTFTPKQDTVTVSVAWSVQNASCPAPSGALTPIYNIQGSGDTSPLAGQTVTTRGVVTGDFQTGGYNGFFIQDPTGDNNLRTSDGIFVYDDSDAVAPGDLVQLSAKVSEFNSLTELGSVSSFTVCGTGQSVKATTLTLPVTAESDLEAYEGMLVTFPQTLTVSENYNLGRYGELLLSSGGRLFSPNNDGNPNTFGDEPEGSSELALTRRSILLDDGSTKQDVNPVPYLNSEGTRRDGDTVTNLTGVLNEAFGSYLLEPTVPPEFVNANPRPTEPKSVGGTLKVAAFNLDNYFTTIDNGSNGARGADSETEFQRQQAKLVAALKALNADVVGLAELQNNGMTAEDALVNALNEAYGSDVYAAVPDPVEGVGTDAIKVGIIYKPAKVTPLGPSVSDPKSIYNRYPVAQAFTQKGAAGGTFTFVINHLKSKGGCPASGDNTDMGQGCWNKRRTAQAQALLSFVTKLQDRIQDPDVLLMGDFNSYLEEDPITALTQGGLTDFSAELPRQTRYSYVFDGQAGLLDYMFTTSSLAAQVTGETVFHINSDEPKVLDYNTEYNPAYLYQPNMYRSSDHDPDMVGLNLTADDAGPPSGGGGGSGGSGSVFMSEYVESSGNNKAIEVYNGTDAAINLSSGGYQLELYFNGKTSVGQTISLTGTVSGGGTYVIVNSQAKSELLQDKANQTSGSLTFNGDDAVVLRQGGDSGKVLDSLGQVGTDPGSYWGSGDVTTQEHTLVRKPDICSGDTDPTDSFDPAAEWIGYPKDTFSYLGTHTANCGN